jgi:integrase
MPFKLYPPGTRKGNKFWVAKGTAGGQQFEISTKAADRRTAEKVATNHSAAILEQQSGATPDAPLNTFAGAAKLYKESNQIDEPDLGYVDRLVAHLGTRILPTGNLAEDRANNALTMADIKIAAHAIFAQRKHHEKNPKPISNATKNRQVITPAIAVLRHAYAIQLCALVIGEKLRETAPPPKALEIDQAQAVLAGVEAIQDADERARVHCLLILLFLHGPRISEALALSWAEHIDMQGRRWLKKVTKKKGDPVYVWKPMSDELFLALANMPGDRVGKVFPWKDRHEVYDALAPVNAASGIHFTPHMGRHTMNQTLRDLGGDDRALQAASDWSSTKTAKNYSRVKHAEQKKNLDALGGALRGKNLKLVAGNE